MDYQHGDNAYICDADTNALIEILYSATLQPVNGTEWDWSKCECSPQPIPNYRASYNSSDFAGDSKLKVEVAFKDQALSSAGGSSRLKVIVIKDRELQIDNKQTIAAATYAYDDNKIHEYPFYTPSEVPYKLLVDGMSDDVIVNNDQYLAAFPTGSSPSGSLSLSASGKNLTMVDLTATDRDSCLVTFCQHDTLMHVDVVPQKTYTAYVYRLAESDDDYENYCVDKNPNNPPYSPGDIDPYLLADCITPINSLPDPSAFECINRGQDETLDAFMRVGNGQYWSKPHLDLNLPPDLLSYAGPNRLYTLKVHPRQDTTGRYYCNSQPVTHPKKWNHDRDGDGVEDCLRRNVPSAVSVADAETAVNHLYSRMGVHFVLVDGGEVLANYEIKIDGKMDRQESYVFHAFRTNSSYSMLTENPMNELFIVDGLVSNLGNSRGRGLSFEGEGMGTSFIIPTAATTVDIGHELGHAIFGLQHPDQEGALLYEGLENEVHDDLENFMMSGNKINRELDPNKVKPRKYQWNKIHE